MEIFHRNISKGSTRLLFINNCRHKLHDFAVCFKYLPLRMCAHDNIGRKTENSTWPSVIFNSQRIKRDKWKTREGGQLKSIKNWLILFLIDMSSRHSWSKMFFMNLLRSSLYQNILMEEDIFIVYLVQENGKHIITI